MTRRTFAIKNDKVTIFEGEYNKNEFTFTLSVHDLPSEEEYEALFLLVERLVNPRTLPTLK